MKNFIKTISVLLILAIVTSLFTPAFATPIINTTTANNNGLTYEITTDKSRYSWGDTVTLIVKLKNNSGEIIESIGLESIPEYNYWFKDTREYTGVVKNIEADGESTVMSGFTTMKLPISVRLLLPINLIVRRLLLRSFNNSDYVVVKRVKVGLFSYKIGFNTSKVDMNLDTDNDGLIDYLENKYKTNINNPDTDGDGLSDWIELNSLALNPISTDTDGDGITDGNEDYDNDGLSNVVEISETNTDPAFYDTDYDSLSDYDEIYHYGTDPNKADTDGDGVNDGDEIACGSDPLSVDKHFVTDATFGIVNEDNLVSASAKVYGDSKSVGTLEINEVSSIDDIRLVSTIPGYIGNAFDFSVDGNMSSAEITINYDNSVGEINENFQPRIYYFNEVDGSFTELENQIVENGKVTATVTHFSKYILLNKVEFDQVWSMEIEPEDRNSDDYIGIDVVFAIDSSGSMSSNDKSAIRKKVAKNFASKLTEKDRAAVVDFDSKASVYQEFTSDFSLVNKAIDKVDNSGNTSLSAGIKTSIDLFLNDSGRPGVKKYIVFLTDGNGDYSASYTNLAKENNIVIFTIGLGSGVKENVLKNIADGTGGTYYFASAADYLEDIYNDIEFNTRNTVDSNNDGISDYYTQLIMDGLVVNAENLAGFDFNYNAYGNPSDDYDGDGLKNGEEISVKIKNGRPYLVINSSPLYVDTDGDDYDDYTEVKKMYTSPLKYTKIGASSLTNLTNISNYDYQYVAHEAMELGLYFDWSKEKESKSTIINFFYDYASESSIDKNADKIAELAEKEELTDTLNKAVDFFKTFKKLTDAATKINSHQSSVTRMINKANGVTKDAQSSINSAIISINQKKFDDAVDHINEIGKTVKSNEKVISDLNDFVDSDSIYEKDDLDIFDEIMDIGGFIADFLAVINIKSTIKLSFGKKLNKFANKYQTIMGQNIINIDDAGNGIKVGTVVSAAFDLADLGLELREIYTTYGKIIANADALENFIDVIDYVSKNGNDKSYVKNAAYDIEKILLDASWDEFYKQLYNSMTQESAKAGAKIVISIVGDICPYVKVAEVVWDVAELTFSLIGITEYATNQVTMNVYDSLADGMIYLVKQKTYINGNYFDVDEDAMSYIIQLAQIHIVAEHAFYDYLRSTSLWTLFAKAVEGMTKEEIDELEISAIGHIYDRADILELSLSQNLPFYSNH